MPELHIFKHLLTGVLTHAQTMHMSALVCTEERFIYNTYLALYNVNLSKLQGTNSRDMSKET